MAQQPSNLPSAPSDSIVRLSVDPAQNRGRPYVMLLDESYNRIEPDGRATRRMRQVMQILDQSVVRTASERAFGYTKTRQTLTVDWIRVLRTTGEVVSDKPAQEQESDVPAAMSNPVYQEQRMRRVSLSGLAPGTVLDVQFTIEEKLPYRPGDFLVGWNVNSQVPVARSRFVVDVPDGFTPRLLERNLNFTRTEDTRDGRRIYTWAARDVQPYRSEAFAADSNGVVMSIAAGSPGSWNDIAVWYDSLARARYALTPAVGLRIDSLVRASGARTRLDTIRALHRWVAQDLRYVSVALGIGGYQPRAPLDVLSSGFGDCKDKTTLFVAALRRYRLAANPVLLSLGGKPDPRMPSIFQFNHAIAAVQEGNGWTFTDLTAEFVPYGMIPDAYQGQMGLVVLPDGRAQEVRFPVAPVDGNNSTMRIEMTIDSSGHVAGHVRESTRGSASFGMRAAFASPLDSARRVSLHKALAQRFFSADATADSLIAFAGKDFTSATEISYAVRADNVLKPAGESLLFSMNTGFRSPASGFKNLARDLEARNTRVFPIDAAQILGQVETVTDLRLTLPVGWKAELPKNIASTSFFGRYESTWSQVGREVRLIRRIQGQRGLFLPQRISEVIVWLKTVGADDYEFLSLRPARVP
jgi:transglutaminase-like putative cysteine protease